VGIDIHVVIDETLDSSAKKTGKSSDSSADTCPDSGPQSDLLESLTQAFIPSTQKSPAIEEKIAKLIDDMNIGGLSTETVKERADKYPPPKNCKYLVPTTVNEEIWDLLSRRSRTVDLAFQRVQEPLVQGLSALSSLSGQLVKDIHAGKTPKTRQILDQIMDSIALLSNANFKLNTKRRELIKPDLNPPYTRLCKEDIKPSTKLFGDDLSKHLKDMAEAKNQSSYNYKAPFRHKFGRQNLKPYDRTSDHKRPFIGYGRGQKTSPRKTNFSSNRKGQ